MKTPLLQLAAVVADAMSSTPAGIAALMKNEAAAMARAVQAANVALD